MKPPPPNFWRLVVEFLQYDKRVWSVSRTMRIIYWARLALAALPLVAGLIVFDAATSWPRTPKGYDPNDTGEEHLVLQREFKTEQERNREIQQDFKEVLSELQKDLREMQSRQQHIEQSFDTGLKILGYIATILGAISMVFIGQLVTHLTNLRLRKELAQTNKKTDVEYQRNEQ